MIYISKNVDDKLDEYASFLRYNSSYTIVMIRWGESDLSDTYLLTRWLVDSLAFSVCGFVNNWWEIVFFCVVFSFLL